MKIRAIILINSLVWLSNAYSQQIYVPKNAIIPDHPRILISEKMLKAIPDLLANSSVMNNVNETILATCNEIILSEEPTRKLKGIRLLEVSRKSLRNIFYLSYAWKITRDRRFLQRAEQELLTVSKFTDWNPKHFLDVAEMTLAVAIGYDWLFHDLPKSSREVIRKAIYEKGLVPSTDSQFNSWLKMSSNWNQVCNTGIALGALAVYEDYPTEANTILNRSIGSIPLSMSGYAPDGAYPEGYSYWGYGTNYNVIFIDTLEKLFNNDFGLTKRPGFMNTAYYMLNMVGASGKPFNYGDSYPSPTLQPAMFWFAKKLNNPALIYQERKYLTSPSTVDLKNDRFLPLVILWANSDILKKDIAPTQNFWIGRGKTPVALMRSSWTDKNAIFVGIKGGGKRSSHGHLDIGSFVLDANGERWAMDLGMQNYQSLESRGVDLWNMKQNSGRWSVFRLNNFSHNTLTINDQLQNVDGFAPIANYGTEENFKNAQIDMSHIYAATMKNIKRGIAIVNDKYVVVRDELQARKSSTKIRWSFATDARVISTSSNIVVLEKNKKQISVEVKEPANINIQTWSTKPKNSFDVDNSGTQLIGFETTVDSLATTAISVLFKPFTDNPANDLKKPNNVIEIKPLIDWPVKTTK